MSQPARILAGVLGVAQVLAQPGLLAQAQATIHALPTSDTALVGRFVRGPMNLALRVSAAEFDATFGSGAAASWPAEAQARQFFANGGSSLEVVRIPDSLPLAEALTGQSEDLSGLQALTPVSNGRLLLAPELSLLPDDQFGATFASFRAFCEPRGIFFLLDPPPDLPAAKDVVGWVELLVPIDASFCALYFPYLRITLDGVLTTLPASGAMAGIYAKVDQASGIWRSPAGIAWPLQAKSLSPDPLTSTDFDQLNAHNISAIREFEVDGIVPWGARALDRTNTDNRYLSVVRTRGWAAACIQRGLAFTAQQDNNATLWEQIRTSVEEFLDELYHAGALAGATPAEAYFVRCDAQTTTSDDIAAYRVNVLYGLALVRPGEFDVTSLTLPTYEAGRKPSRPDLHAVGWGNELRLAYATEPGLLYELEFSPALASGPWIAITNDSPVIGDGSWRQLELPMSGTEGVFAYRLRATPARP